MSANCYLEHSAFEGVKGFEKPIEGKALRPGLSSASIDCSRYRVLDHKFRSHKGSTTVTKKWSHVPYVDSSRSCVVVRYDVRSTGTDTVVVRSGA